MKVIIANQSQYDRLNGYTNNKSKLLFVKHDNKKWIVGIEVINDPDFIEIKKELELLTQEYILLQNNIEL